MQTAHFFLPAFNDIRVVFMLILMGELFALLLSLAQSNPSLDQFWFHLATTSLFIQWTVLTSAAVLQILSPWLVRRTLLTVIVAIYLTTQLITLMYSLLVLHLFHRVFVLHPIGFPLTNFLLSSLVTLTFLRYLFVLQRWQATVAQQARLQLQVLQARIRPHFLFNSLNAIAGLISHRPQDAENLVLNLATLFRSALAQDHQIPLSEELDLAHRYLAIEQQRLGPRLQVDWQYKTPIPLALALPPLILQPLLENAIYHGIQPCIEGGTVTVILAEIQGILHIDIDNPRPQLPVNSSPRLKEQGQGLALENVRQRLQLSFGDRARCDTFPTADHYRVHLEIPLSTQRP